MEIKVLGTGCAGCKALYETVVQAVADLKIEASVIKEEDVIKIMAYNVMKLPGLVIDERVVSSGRRLSLQEVKDILIKNSDTISCPCGANDYCRCQ